jgi:hypothetical protein
MTAAKMTCKRAPRDHFDNRNCAVGDISISNWLGKVSQLSSNGDGKGVLTLTVAPDISVGTWNNDFSDIGDHTLIDPRSAVFSKASATKEGQWVWFSGEFRPSDVDCIKESSITIDGSMDEPNFIFEFSDLSAAQ